MTPFTKLFLGLQILAALAATWQHNALFMALVALAMWITISIARESIQRKKRDDLHDRAETDGMKIVMVGKMRAALRKLEVFITKIPNPTDEAVNLVKEIEHVLKYPIEKPKMLMERPSRLSKDKIDRLIDY